MGEERPHEVQAVVALLIVATAFLVVTAAPAGAQQGRFSAGAPGSEIPTSRSRATVAMTSGTTT